MSSFTFAYWQIHQSAIFLLWVTSNHKRTSLNKQNKQRNLLALVTETITDKLASGETGVRTQTCLQDALLAPIPLCWLLSKALCSGPWNLQVPIFLTYSLLEDERKTPFPMSVANLSSTEKSIVAKRMCKVKWPWRWDMHSRGAKGGLRVGRLPGGKWGHYDQSWGNGRQNGMLVDKTKHVHFMI